ncbi:MAG: NTP transferase domain-containing protein [Anaerolineae bacterium]|nr:NTP transferase domain-containing protein [Anaerolineae bacterium]
MKPETAKQESLPVVVLCGGEGTRMRGSTPTKKELVKVGGRPIIWHVMKIYATYGHTHFILTLGHRAQDLKRYFLEYESTSCDFTVRLGQSGAITYHQSNTSTKLSTSAEENWEVTLADTGLDTEKGSRIYRVARYINTGAFFVTYGDGVGDVDIDALLAFHRQHGRLATVTGVRPPSPYGILQVDETGQINGFAQKPQMEHWINGGFMVFERGVLDYLAGGDDVHLERAVLPRLAAEGQLMMYRHTGFWRKMDTLKEALALDKFWRESAPWKTWDNEQ